MADELHLNGGKALQIMGLMLTAGGSNGDVTITEDDDGEGTAVLKAKALANQSRMINLARLGGMNLEEGYAVMNGEQVVIDQGWGKNTVINHEVTGAILYATVADGQTVTLQKITPTGGNVVVDWGDGGDTSTILEDNTGTTTHVYTSAGTYTITLSDPELITYLDLRDAKLTVNSADIAVCENVTTVLLTVIKSTAFNSSDIAAWRPTDFKLYSTNASFVGTFNSSDISAWRPDNFWLRSIPAGFAGTFDSADISDWRPGDFEILDVPSAFSFAFDSADISDWRPSTFWVFSMSGISGTFDSADISDWRPTNFQMFSLSSELSGTFDSADVSDWKPTSFYLHSLSLTTYTLTAGGFAGWITTNTFRMQGNGLLTAAVNQILADFWAGFATRTATGGTINVSGTNEAPSGTYEAADPPTTGKEFAYELLNDSEDVNPTKKWATITVTGGLS